MYKKAEVQMLIIPYKSGQCFVILWSLLIKASQFIFFICQNLFIFLTVLNKVIHKFRFVL